MGDAAPILRRRHILQPHHLAFAEDIPQAEIDLQSPIGLHQGLPGYQALGLDRTPIAKPRRRVDVGDSLDERSGIERAEEPRTFQIGAHHRGDVPARLPRPEEIGNGERNGFGDALIDADLQRGFDGRKSAHDEAQSEHRGENQMPPEAA
jgi:hypothetical protein